VATTFKKVVGISAIGAISLMELLQLQQASAAPMNFAGATYSNPRGGSVQVSITVDGASGVYRITSITTPVQPGGQNGSYAAYAIPTLTSSALAAQSANVQSVSGASQISAAWKSSLSSAIGAANAAGNPIGQSASLVTAKVTPTPTVTTPAPTPTVAPSSSTSTKPPTPTSSIVPTSVGVAPTFTPFVLPAYSASSSTSTADLSSYLSQISYVISQLSRGGGEDVKSSSIANARSVLYTLQAQVQSDSSLSPSSPAALKTYVDNVNNQLSKLTALTNQAIVDYYAAVKAAADKLYTDAKTSADKLMADAKASAAALAVPTPTKSAALTVPKTGIVIKKSFTCSKTLGGKTTTKIIKAFIVKCPPGFTIMNSK
jgi:uncharacterized protein with FMN-binding domain